VDRQWHGDINFQWHYHLVTCLEPKYKQSKYNFWNSFNVWKSSNPKWFPSLIWMTFSYFLFTSFELFFIVMLGDTSGILSWDLLYDNLWEHLWSLFFSQAYEKNVNNALYTLSCLQWLLLMRGKGPLVVNYRTFPLALRPYMCQQRLRFIQLMKQTKKYLF
jgi:hypothetical protein